MKSTTPFLLTFLTATSLLCLTCTPVDAGGFGNRQAGFGNRVFGGRQATNLDSSPYNKTGRPLTNFGYNWVARKNEQDTRVSNRTGTPVEQVRDSRMRRIEMFGAAVEGAGAGLGGAADTLNSYNSRNFGSNTSSPSLGSNFSQQSNWNSFNRNYSTNPNHAPVN